MHLYGKDSEGKTGCPVSFGLQEELSAFFMHGFLETPNC